MAPRAGRDIFTTVEFIGCCVFFGYIWIRDTEYRIIRVVIEEKKKYR
jgi:hypothetical protein